MTWAVPSGSSPAATDPSLVAALGPGGVDADDDPDELLDVRAGPLPDHLFLPERVGVLPDNLGVDFLANG